MASSKIFMGMLLVLISLSFAIQLEKPFEQELTEGETIDLGTIGPGQTVTLEIQPVVESGGIYGVGGRYDYALATELPEGWRSTPSKLYGDPLQVAVTAAPDAAEGEYIAQLTIVDEEKAEQLGDLTFPLRIRIEHDVMDSSVTPLAITTGPGQPGRYYITVKNKGTTSDVFEVSVQGARRWEFKRYVFLPPQSEKTIYYEIVEEEEEFYTPIIQVVSTSSDLIKETHEVTFRVQPTLFGDYRAMNNGIMLFPVFESSIYALAGWISNFVD